MYEACVLGRRVMMCGDGGVSCDGMDGEGERVEGYVALVC